MKTPNMNKVRRVKITVEHQQLVYQVKLTQGFKLRAIEVNMRPFTYPIQKQSVCIRRKEKRAYQSIAFSNAEEEKPIGNHAHLLNRLYFQSIRLF